MSNVVTGALQGAGFSNLTAEVSDDNICTLTGACRDAETLAKAESIVAGFELDGIELDAVEFSSSQGGEEVVPLMQAAIDAAGFENIEVVFDNGDVIVNGLVADDEEEDKLLELVDNFGLDNIDWTVVPQDMDDADDVEIEGEEFSADADVQTYTVKKGDSWWRIAKNTLGDGRKWKVLKAHNGSPKVIHPGQVLQIPSLNEA